MCCGSLTIISIRKSEQGLEQKRDSWKTEIFRELSRKEPQLTYKNLMEMLGLVSENNGEYHIKPHSHLRTTPRLLHFVSHSQDFPATLYDPAGDAQADEGLAAVAVPPPPAEALPPPQPPLVLVGDRVMQGDHRQNAVATGS